jgi:hypothetical protein
MRSDPGPELVSVSAAHQARVNVMLPFADPYMTLPDIEAL